LFLAGCLAAVGTALIVAMQYWDDFFPVKPGRQTEYLGLRFGMSRDEVRYVKGVPENVVGGEKDKDGFLAVLKSSEVPKAKTTD